MSWQDSINRYLTILGLGLLTEKEIFLLENSNIIDESNPCYLANLLRFLLEYRVKNSLCIRIDNEMLKSIANELGCTIADIPEPEADASSYFIEYFGGGCGCGK